MTEGKSSELIFPSENLWRKIYIIRECKVMIDSDLAELYKVPTKRINEAVKRNARRFPNDFMFQLTQDEWNNLRSQFATSSWGASSIDKPTLSVVGFLFCCLLDVFIGHSTIAANITLPLK